MITFPSNITTLSLPASPSNNVHLRKHVIVVSSAGSRFRTSSMNLSRYVAGRPMKSRSNWRIASSRMSTIVSCSQDARAGQTPRRPRSSSLEKIELAGTFGGRKGSADTLVVSASPIAGPYQCHPPRPGFCGIHLLAARSISGFKDH